MVYSTRRFVLCLTLCYFVIVYFSPSSIAITSLGEERANPSAFRTFVRFTLVWLCLFPLPLDVWEELRFVIVALPGLFAYFFFFFFFFCKVRGHARKHMILVISTINGIVAEKSYIQWFYSVNFIRIERLTFAPHAADAAWSWNYHQVSLWRILWCHCPDGFGIINEILLNDQWFLIFSIYNM